MASRAGLLIPAQAIYSKDDTTILAGSWPVAGCPCDITGNLFEFKTDRGEPNQQNLCPHSILWETVARASQLANFKVVTPLLSMILWYHALT